MPYEQYAFRKGVYQTPVADVWIRPEYHPDIGMNVRKMIKLVSNPTVSETALKADMPGICFGSMIAPPVWSCYKVTALANMIETTQLLMIDVDECPEKLENVPKYLETVLGPLWYLWYTTPKSTRLHPRFRLLLCCDRPITMAEKRALSVPLTQALPGVDKASFEPSKFCLLPCICAETTEPDNYGWGGSESHFMLKVDNYDIKPKPIVKIQEHKYTNDRILMIKLNALIQEINDAPNGHSQEVIKPGLSKIFRQFHVNMNMLEDMAVEIDRYDRRSDFLGIAKWLSKQ